ncbi:MAG: class I SAM-dependent methyltransferase, partial [Thermoanaerobaculum sp.]
MSTLPQPIPRQTLRALLADVPEEVFTEAFTQACEVLDAFVGDCLRFLVHQLSLAGFAGRPEALVRSRGYSPHGLALVRWLFDSLCLYGLGEEHNGTVHVPASLPTVDLEAAFAAAVAASPQAQPAMAVQKLATQALPDVLAGKTTGEEALFSLSQLDLWFSYFSNRNIHYAPTNSLAALALARAVGPKARILELGGGGGSAAEAAFKALVDTGKPPAIYVFTEVHPAFLRRGSRLVRQLLPEGCQLEARPYDIELSPEEQGLSGALFDAVFAVNVLHLASDAVLALQRLRTVLAPGGALILGELIRPSFHAPVHLELPFLLLKSYQQAKNQDGIRSRPGFLCQEGWQNALRAAGFTEVTVLP